MSRRRRQGRPGEVAVCCAILAFGAAAPLAFPPLLLLYALACVLWLASWSSSDDPK